MRQYETAERDGPGRSLFPWFGVASSSLIALLMLGVTVVLWPELPKVISVSRPGLDTGSTPITRWLFVTVVPGVALATVLCVGAGAALGGRVIGLRALPLWPGRSACTLMNFLLVLTNMFLLALHTIVLGSGAGRPFAPSVEHLAPLVTGALLAVLGLLIATWWPQAARAGSTVRWWRRVRKPAGVSTVVVGAMAVAAGLLDPRPMVWPHLLGLLPLALIAVFFVPFLGNQDRKNQFGSYP